MNRPTLTATLLVLTAAQANASPQLTAIQNACSPKERWISGKLSQKAPWERLKQTPASQFAEAVVARKRATTPKARAVAEYEIARALHRAKLDHLAHSGFQIVAKRAYGPVSLAALQCLNTIEARLPTLNATNILLSTDLDAIRNAKITGAEPILAERVARIFSHANGRESDQRWLELLGQDPTSSATRDWIQARLSAEKGDLQKASEHLNRLLTRRSLPPFLAKKRSQARSLAANIEYELGNFQKAQRYLKALPIDDPGSNELGISLEKLAWTYLLQNKRREAVGAALNLQQAGFRQVFAPEAPMVMAIAYNEICQYPHALNSISMFRKKYGPVQAWLKNRAKTKKRRSIYQTVINHLRKKDRQSEIPELVVTEWLRLPGFLNHQSEINAMIDQKRAAQALLKAAAHEERAQAMSIRQTAAELLPRIRRARIQLGPGELLSEEILTEVRLLRESIQRYRRFRAAAPVWRAMFQSFDGRMKKRSNFLVRRIEIDFERRTREMMAAINQVSKQVELVEVEIFSGASQDLVWKNAHPDYEAKAKAIHARESGQDRAPAGDVLDWGKGRELSRADAEIWEDELGSFRSELIDNCSSKDKYLTLSRHTGAKK